MPAGLIAKIDFDVNTVHSLNADLPEEAFAFYTLGTKPRAISNCVKRLHQSFEMLPSSSELLPRRIPGVLLARDAVRGTESAIESACRE
jgi:hypothetical protein